MILQNLSIKRKLTLITMLTSSAALILSALSFLVYDLVSFRHLLIQDLMTQAEIIGYNSAGAMEFKDEPAATDTATDTGTAADTATDTDPGTDTDPAGVVRNGIDPQTLDNARVLLTRVKRTRADIEREMAAETATMIRGQFNLVDGGKDATAIVGGDARRASRVFRRMVKDAGGEDTVDTGRERHSQ